MELNVQDWKEFNVSRTKKQPGLLIIEHCKCGCAGDLEDGNDICYIGAKKSDNGIMKHVKMDKSLVSKGNGIMIICDGQGSVGYSNYMKDDFIGSTTTSIGYDEEINPIRAMFIVTCLDLDRYKYSYGRKYRPSMNKAIIKLPIQYDLNKNPVIDSKKKYSKEGYIPNWEFMENYIKSLHYKPITTKVSPRNIKSLETNKWEEFRIDKLFKIELSKGDIKTDDIDDGPVRLISSGETDNGIVAHINSNGDGKAKIFEGNVITADMFCNVHYQNKPFFAVSHGRVNILLPKFECNQYIGLFISAIINKEKYKYSYGRALYSNVVSSMIIKLPIQKDDSGNSIIDATKEYSDEGYIPDWSFMEDYIKSLPYSDRI